MAVGTADLHRAIIALWDSSGLDTEFKSFWDASDRDIYPTIHDGEATPQQPFPYCVYPDSTSGTTIRMSGHSTGEKHEIRDVDFTFNVFAKKLVGNANTAKQIAADLAEKIMQKFGGHPTVKAQSMSLDNGNVLLGQHQGDWGIRLGDDEHQWTINYNFRLDVPVMV